MTRPDLIVIGAIAGAHGVKGEAKLRAFGDPDALCGYGAFLDETGKAILTPVRARRSGGETVVAAFAEPLTREDVMAMKGTLLHVPRDLLPETDEDEFYHSDLVGLAVADLEGKPLGRVKAVQNYGAGDLLEIDASPAPGWFLPFTKTAVPHVDIAAGKLVADPPEVVE